MPKLLFIVKRITSYFDFRNYLITSIILITFAVWINGQSVEHESSLNRFSKNETHWTNCTINGTTHYDEDCYPWIGKFIAWIGVGLFVIFFLLCGCLWFCVCTICRIICCTERPREVIYTTYVYPSSSSYSQIP